ncbi:MAG: site-specific integrase [Rubrivivax sp.]|nr:site-specific integrase [Rubrivivax sp.]
MASLITKNGKLLARVRIKGFKPVAKAFDKASDARKWAQETEQAMRSGTYCPDADTDRPTGASLLTFGEALKQYREAVGDRLKGADTYAYWFDEIAASALAPKLLRDVTPAEVSAWRDEQAKTRAAGTVARKLGLLGGFLGWAVKDKHWLASNPVHSVRKPRAATARDRVLTTEERAYLMEAAATGRGKWLGDALIVLLQSAMRRGELAKLRRGDVDYDKATAHLVETKNGADRLCPLDPQALAALKRLDEAARERGTECMIPVQRPHALTLAFRRAVARGRALYAADRIGVKAPDAGFLQCLHLHDCRHTAITHWASTGGLNLLELQAISGHRTVSMLSRYTHLDRSALAGKMARVAA